MHFDPHLSVSKGNKCALFRVCPCQTLNLYRRCIFWKFRTDSLFLFWIICLTFSFVFIFWNYYIIVSSFVSIPISLNFYFFYKLSPCQSSTSFPLSSFKRLSNSCRFRPPFPLLPLINKPHRGKDTRGILMEDWREKALLCPRQILSSLTFPFQILFWRTIRIHSYFNVDCSSQKEERLIQEKLSSISHGMSLLLSFKELFIVHWDTLMHSTSTVFT